MGLENDDQLVAIDTLTTGGRNVPIGQAAQAVVYVPGAVAGTATENLQPLALAGEAARFTMVSPGQVKAGSAAPTSVTLFEQGLVQVLEGAVTGLTAGHSYVLALASRADGSGTLEVLAGFKANPAGAAIVNAIGPIRQVVQGTADPAARRYLVIAEGTSEKTGPIIQVQAPGSGG